MPRNEESFILQDLDLIKNFIGKISIPMYDYIANKKNSNFILFYKYITHSDLATFGKATQQNSHDNNLLYYIKKDEMLNIENQTGKPFQTAHQSCIGLKSELYDLIGLPNPRGLPSRIYCINDYMNVFLVNQNLKYFTSFYTKKVFDTLGKVIPNSKLGSWDFDNLNINLTNDDFTPIKLHIAAHGIGYARQDVEFHKLRHHIFKSDTFLLLYEQNGSQRNLFVLLEKNPIFYSIIGEANDSYTRFQELTRARLISSVTGRRNAISEEQLEDEITRQQQAAWKKMLANEMMGYTQVNNQVFCPFTYITGDFDNLSSLFIASHIKGFKDPNTRNEEKYDINNGLLLCANADALFDKHLITVNENKEIIFSFLLDGDDQLKSKLLLLTPIFKPILNQKRMEYLAYHRQKFFEEEAKRRAA